jgi:hypothetical protein
METSVSPCLKDRSLDVAEAAGKVRVYNEWRKAGAYIRSQFSST